MNSPIADLSYRSYDGPLVAPNTQWWPIAKMMMRLCIKAKGFWVWSILSSWAYFIYLIVYYVGDASSQGLGNDNFWRLVKWRDDFVNCFGFSQLFLFVVAVLIGAGSIANDNRANALLVYLSRPITKVDYLLGKWLGIMIPITCVTFVPMFIFYAYCGMSYSSHGFFSQDPWLFVQIPIVAICAGAFQASVVLGVSSLFNQSSLSGAAYAAIYFIGIFFTKIVGAIYTFQDEARNSFFRNIYYFSIDGLQIGIAKVLFGTDGSRLQFLGPNQHTEIARPDILFIVLVPIIVMVAMITVAWSRIRPVEIIGG